MLLYLRLGFLFVWLCFVGRFSWPCPFTWGLWGLGSVVAASLAPETLFHADVLFSPREGIGLCVSPLITVYEQEGNILFIKCFVFGCEWFVMHTRLCCRFLWFFWSLWRGWCNLLAAMLMGLRTVPHAVVAVGRAASPVFCLRSLLALCPQCVPPEGPDDNDNDNEK